MCGKGEEDPTQHPNNEVEQKEEDEWEKLSDEEKERRLEEAELGLA